MIPVTSCPAAPGRVDRLLLSQYLESPLPFGPVSKLTCGNGRTQTRAHDLDYAIDRITVSVR